MRKLFYDSALEAQFLRDGFAVVPHFMSAEQCQHLQEVFARLQTGFSKGFHVTNWSGNFDYRQTTHEEVTKAMLPMAAKLAIDYKPVLGAYAVKYPGEESEMGIHQDWSLADESLCHTFSIWCPTIDVNETNGVMQFYRGSHNLYPSLRGLNIPYDWKPEQQDIIDHRLENVSVKAGDAILIHHRVVHRSLPNRSSVPRPVAMMAMIPKELSVRQYFGETNKIEYREQPDDFYVHYQVEVY